MMYKFFAPVLSALDPTHENDKTEKDHVHPRSAGFDDDLPIDSSTNRKTNGGLELVALGTSSSYIEQNLASIRSQPRI